MKNGKKIDTKMNKLYKIKFRCQFVGNILSPAFITEENETKALSKFLDMVNNEHPINNIKIKFICDMDKIK